MRKEYYRRVRLVLKSELNAANRFEAVNTLAVPVVTYSFNIINWKMSEIKRLDTKTRKLLTIHRMHHPKAELNWEIRNRRFQSVLDTFAVRMVCRVKTSSLTGQPVATSKPNC